MDNIFKATSWKGGQWLIFLCVTQLILVVTYLFSHRDKNGYEYIQLDKKQATVVNNLLLMYNDTEAPTTIMELDTSAGAKPKLDRYKKIRKARTYEVMLFLKTEYDGDIDADNKATIEASLDQYNTTQASLYLANLKIKVKSYFWLSGGKAYYEALLWCLLGVFTSLIFYVGQKITPCDPDEKFDINEISNQVAKIFYAPITTLVLIIGYHFIGGNNSNMIDITVNKGVILFAFLAGFYSGRVMKLMDKIKDLILPATKEDKSAPADPEGQATVNVQLSLAPTLAATPEGNDITEAGFNAAVVTLKPFAGGDPVTLTNPAEDQQDTFTSSKIKFGKYKLMASYTYKNVTGDTIINLEGTQDIEINAKDKKFDVILDKTNHQG